MMGSPSVIVLAIDCDTQPLIDELERRRIRVIPAMSDGDVRASSPTSIALLVLSGPRRIGVVEDRIAALFDSVIDFGTNIVLGVPPAEVNLYTDRFKIRTEMPVSTQVSFAGALLSVSILEPVAIANHVSGLRRGPTAVTSLTIDPPTFSPEHRVLVQRAFAGFNRVVVTQLTSGKTATVYRVDAIGAGPPRPLPFIMKIGSRRKIAEEYDNFVDNVSDYVQFSSRPNLVRERCVLGSKYGILVGNFIEHAESLDKVLLRAPAPGVLHSVFEDLLRGWWRLGETESKVSKPL